MVLGARDAQSKGMVLLYRSMDLKNWEYFNRITTDTNLWLYVGMPGFILSGRPALPGLLPPGGGAHGNRISECASVYGLLSGL